MNINSSVPSTKISDSLQTRIRNNPNSTVLIGNKGPRISHVQQGVMHTDWIFAPIMAILGLDTGPRAEIRRSYIEKLFFEDQLAKSVVGVALCVLGKWEVIRLDGKIPMWRRKF